MVQGAIREGPEQEVAEGDWKPKRRRQILLNQSNVFCNIDSFNKVIRTLKKNFSNCQTVGILGLAGTSLLLVESCAGKVK